MKNFWAAAQFLTVIPFGIKTTGDKELRRSVIYFPLIGLLLGLILAGLNLIFFFLAFNPLLSSVITVIALIALTGSLHLDGLADTCDAFYCAKTKDDILKIMRDPHIGTIGVVALISVILFKAAVLFSLCSGVRNIALIFMCVLSRWSLMLPVYLFNYARQEGKAKEFFGGLNFSKFSLVTAVVLLSSCIIWGWKGLSVFTLSFLFTYFFNGYVNKKIDGVTGDTLGAAVELNEALILAACLIISKI